MMSASWKLAHEQPCVHLCKSHRNNAPLSHFVLDDSREMNIVRHHDIDHDA